MDSSSLAKNKGGQENRKKDAPNIDRVKSRVERINLQSLDIVDWLFNQSLGRWWRK